MMLLSRIAAALVLCLALVAPAAAQGLTAAQQQALGERAALFGEATRTSNTTQLLGLMPPKVFEDLARAYLMAPEDLIEVTQQQIGEALKSLKIESVDMDLDAAESFTLADGMIYVLIPIQVVIDYGAGGRQRGTTSTLALLDGDTWHVMAIDDVQQVSILKKVYPAMTAVQFPVGTTEAVTQ